MNLLIELVSAISLKYSKFQLPNKPPIEDKSDTRFLSVSSTHKRRRNDAGLTRKDKRKEERKTKKLKKSVNSTTTIEDDEPLRHTSSKIKSIKSSATLKLAGTNGKPKKAVKFTDSQVFDFDAEKSPGHRMGSAKIAKLSKPVIDDSDSEGDFGFGEGDSDEDDFSGFGSDEEEGQEEQSVDDTWAALKALKDKKNAKNAVKNVKTPASKNLDTPDSVMAALKAAKEAKKSKSKPESPEDVMAALKAAKAAKAAKNLLKSKPEAKIEKSQTKSKKPETAEDVMAALKAAKAKKTKSREPETAEDVMAALKAVKAKKSKSREPETAEDVMAALKAAKAAKTTKKPAEVAAKSTKTPEKKSPGTSLADLIKSRESKGSLESLDTSTKKKSNVMLTKEEKRKLEQDEEEIDYYSRMLGMKDKRGKMPKSEEEEDDDDLDGLLDGLDLDFGDGYNNLDDDDSDGEDIPDLVDEHGKSPSSAKKAKKDVEDESNGLPFSSDDEIDSDDFDSDVDLEGLEDDDEDDADDDDMDDIDDEDDNDDDDENDDDSDILEDSEDEAPKRENPYVAPVSAGKYIPPAARKRLEAAGNVQSEELTRLRRLVKGPLNRLTEANIASIVQEIDRLYLHHPRHHLTSIITSIVIDSTALQGTLLDSFLMVHAALVAALYKTSGLEFGAYFLQTLVETFDKHYNQAASSSTRSFSKEANNLLSLLAELYSFQVVSCGLIYDLIRMLLDGEIDEAKTELLLKLVRSCGSQLRSDDPAALKEIIYQLQVSVSKTDPKSINFRIKFLVETISVLKNNRQSKAATVSETTSAAKTRMKKFLGTIQGKTSEPLSVSLNDIRNVETRGKWWLVGSAWRNSGGANSNNNGGLNDDDEIDLAAMEDILENAEPDWMELARKQRMNTDVRRAVFIALMSSEDYVDACDRLQRLKLRSKQEREIPRVILHCCCNEEIYNPFYQVVATRLCAQRSIRKTFQFALWDFLTELEGGLRNEQDDDDDMDLDREERMEKLKRQGDLAANEEITDEQKLRKTVHMARLYASFAAEGITSLDILKTANFVSPTAETQIFLELFFITLYTQLAKKQSSNQGNTNRKKMSFGESMFQKPKIDEKGLVQLLVKTSQITDSSGSLMKKIDFFIQKKLLKSSAIGNAAQREKVEWGVNVTSDIIDELNSKSAL